MTQPVSIQILQDENAALRARLAEAEETLDAIHQGRVDAVVVDGPQHEQVFTLQGADHPYRVMIETMQEGALTLIADGTILFSNESFARLVRAPLEKIVGANVRQFITSADQERFAALLEHGLAVSSTGELNLTSSDGTRSPVLFSLTSLRTYDVPAVCVVVTDLTDQKRYAELAVAQQALRTSEERLRLATAAAQMYGWEVDLVHQTFTWSANATQVVDFPMPRTLAEVPAVVHPDDRTKVIKAFAQAMKKGSEFQIEYRIANRTSENELWVFSAGVAIPAADGSPARVVGVTQNITTRKRAEAALREREARLRALVNLVPAMMWEAAPDGTMTTVSERWLNYTGLTAEHMARDWARLTLHPDDYEHCVAQWTCALAHGAPYEVEVRNRRHDGEYRWFLTRAIPVYDDTGRIIVWYGTTTDIHDRKLIEDALRESEQELADFFDNATVGLHWVDADGIILRVNQAELDLLGYTREEYVGHHIAEFYDDRAVIHDILHRLTRGEVLHDYPARLRSKDGSIKDVLIDSSVLWKDGRFLHTRCFTRDITERKQAEVERERLLAELQRINAELQQFAYIVSHDLNEPLRTMANYVQLLARRTKGKLDGEAEEYMAFVADAAQRMQQMLADLLAYTRAGQTPEFTAVDCEALLAQVLTTLQTRVTECEASITHDPLPTVQGDATRLGQVLQNLIGNGLKFCREQPRIHVSASKESRHWKFAVRDNGIGIDPQQAGKLFQVFQRLHSRSEYPGTGIGLAICKRIVEQHGGRIWVESKLGEGSIFYFTIADRR